MLVEFFTIGLGLIGLWLGTEWVISNAVVISRHYGLSELFIGLAILSLGSNLPELAVAIGASFDNLGPGDSSGVVVGTSVGSAFAQFGLVMGIAGLTGYLVLSKSYIYRHGAVLLGSIVALGVCGWDGTIHAQEGVLLCTLFVVYLFSLVIEEKILDQRPLESSAQRRALIWRWVFLIAGFAVITGASEVTVSAVTGLSQTLGVQQSLVSILLVGLGTSLPELSISLGAMARKKSALSIGNLVGSNIFDTLVPVGAAALISPIVFDREFVVYDLPVLFVLSGIVLFFFLRKKGLQRIEAWLLIGLYLLYATGKLLQ